MLVLHTTERVRKRWKLKVDSVDILPGPQPFRHWQIDTFPAAGKSWVLFLEGTTYWSVLVPFGPWKTVVKEFHRTFCFDLTLAGARPEIVGEFESWGDDFAIQPYLNKRALGVWNQFSFYAQLELDRSGDSTRAQDFLRRCPTGALKQDVFPDKALARVLAEG